MTRDIAIHAVDVTNVIQRFHTSTNNTATALPCRHLSQHATLFRYVKPQSTSLLKILFFQEKVSLGRQTHAERACRRQFRAGRPIIALAGGQGMCLGLGQVWLDFDDLCCFG